MNCYIVDDEAHSIEVLRSYIARTPGLQLIKAFRDPLQALREIQPAPPQPSVTFLDVDMPEISGLELAGLIHTQTRVIFTTAFREYALDAFEKEAVDYLVKPIRYERFVKCIQKLERESVFQPPAGSPRQDFFFIKSETRGKLTRVSFQDILFIRAALNYVEIFTGTEKLLTYSSLQDLLQELPEEQFSRIHKSFIVRHGAISSIEFGQLRIPGQAPLPMGRVYRKAFHEKMQTQKLLNKKDQPE